MCECTKCSVTAFLVGMTAGVLLMLYNKNARKTLQNGKEKAEQKLNELKESTADVMEDASDKIDNVAKKIRNKKE